MNMIFKTNLQWTCRVWSAQKTTNSPSTKWHLVYVSHTETFCETLVGYIRTGFPEWTINILTLGGAAKTTTKTKQPGSCSQLIFLTCIQRIGWSTWPLKCAYSTRRWFKNRVEENASKKFRHGWCINELTTTKPCCVLPAMPTWHPMKGQYTTIQNINKTHKTPKSMRPQKWNMDWH